MSSFLKTCHCGRRALPGTARCALHPLPARTQAERLDAQPWRRAYADPMYRFNRERCWERSGHRCQACDVELGPWEYICDHILPLSDGGTNAIDNLQILCAPCSKLKTRRDRRARSQRTTR